VSGKIPQDEKEFVLAGLEHSTDQSINVVGSLSSEPWSSISYQVHSEEGADNVI
jgi:hypothetical protein